VLRFPLEFVPFDSVLYLIIGMSLQSTMRSAYEKGYKVYTLKDCTAATSIEAHEATLEHNFGMFSVPTTSVEMKTAIQA
jgi:nicotinamidase-related amidase